MISQTQQPNPSKRAAQLTKASKICAHLRAHGVFDADPDLSALPTMDDEWWRACARDAGVQHRTAPSSETRELVLSFLRSELRERKRVEAGGSPFDGLPKGCADA